MKYKNIHSAIHNFGHSFLSGINYVDGEYVMHDLEDIRANGHDIEVDWLNRAFTPEQEVTPRISKSMDHYATDLLRHLKSHQVDPERLQALKLFLPAKGRKYMWAKDDRGKEYKIYVAEIK